MTRTALRRIGRLSLAALLFSTASPALAALFVDRAEFAARKAQPSIRLGLLPVAGKLVAPEARLRVAGRYPALASLGGRLYMAWWQGDDARLLAIAS